MTIVKYKNKLMSPGIFDLLGDIFSEDLMKPMVSFRNESVPAVNVSEDEKSFNLEVAVPGFEKKDINVEVDENILTISSSRKTEKSDSKNGYSRKEFNYTTFRRSFNIPDEADTSKIEAKQENGLLNISIPKKEVVLSQKKQIRVE